MKTLTLYTRFTFTAPQGTISDAGIVEIQEFIQRQNLAASLDWHQLNPARKSSYLPALPLEWAWVWMVERGDYSGTFPRRVARYYHKLEGIKCPPSFLQELGNIARRHSQTGETYHFEFVDTLDWEEGDFGDGGSCYWGHNAAARDMLRENDGMAICFYDADGDGIGRAWVAEMGDALYIVWNGYGFAGDATRAIVCVMAGWLNLSYKRIELSNNGLSHGMLWINGSAGYVIGRADGIESIKRYDLSWPDIYDLYCESCGCGLHEDDAYYGADGYPYCSTCFYEAFDTCEHCGEVFYHDDVYYADDQYYCERCLDRLFTRCDGCDEYIRNADIHEVEGHSYCENCFPDSPDED